METTVINNENKFFDFEKAKVQTLTIDQLEKTHKENDVYGNPNGRYILSLANHLCAVVDGKIRDGWNCGDKCIYKIYIINEK